MAAGAAAGGLVVKGRKERSMRIAHVTATFPPYRGGTGAVCYYNAVGLAKRGHEVHVYTADYADMPHDAHDDPPEITVHRLRPAFRFGNAPLLPGLLGLKNFDLVHLHWPFIFGAELVGLNRLFGSTRIIITYHNDLIGIGTRKMLFDIYTAFSARFVLPMARRYGAVSLDHIMNCGLTPYLTGREEKIVEIPNGVDATLFNPAVGGNRVRHENNIPMDARVILFVGALDQAHHFKGINHLITTAAELQNQHIYLMIVGEGELKDEYEALATQLGLQATTRFTGAKSHSELPAYYAAADILVLPSFPPESFGMVLIEAMACGKPVIASRLPGVRSVVSDGEDGLLVEPGDVHGLATALRTLLDDPDRRRAMGLCGRAKVEAKYAWPQIISRLETIYQEVLAE
jgi:glycosyltransferase involved in cell wall biosynthesis